MMEYWNTGVLGLKPITPSLHYSNPMKFTCIGLTADSGCREGDTNDYRRRSVGRRAYEKAAASSQREGGPGTDDQGPPHQTASSDVGQAAPLLSGQRAAQGALYSCQLSGERDQDGAHAKIYGGRRRQSDRRQGWSPRGVVAKVGRGFGDLARRDGRFPGFVSRVPLAGRFLVGLCTEPQLVGRGGDELRRGWRYGQRGRRHEAGRGIGQVLPSAGVGTGAPYASLRARHRARLIDARSDKNICAHRGAAEQSPRGGRFQAGLSSIGRPMHVGRVQDRSETTRRS